MFTDQDNVTGGDGIDAANYYHSATGLTVDLQDTSNNTGDAAGDTYISIEILRDSLFSDDLRGDAQSNVIVARDGNDMNR